MGSIVTPALPSFTLIDILNNEPDPLSRRWAAFAIGELGADGKAAIPVLVKILTEPPPEDRRDFEVFFPAVAAAVGKLGRGNIKPKDLDRIRDRLVQYRNDPNLNIRNWAVQTLVDLGISMPETSGDKPKNYTDPADLPPSLIPAPDTKRGTTKQDSPYTPSPTPIIQSDAYFPAQ